MVKEVAKNPAQVSEEIAEEYIRNLMESNLPTELFMPAFEQTKAVQNAAQKLAEAANVSEEERRVLLLAAVFHLSGLTVTQEDFLKESQTIAGEFLEKQGDEARDIAEVQRLIATLQPEHQPDGLLEKLFLDASHANFSSKKFLPRPWTLQTVAPQNGQAASDLAKEKQKVKALKKHRFFTFEAEELFGAERQELLSKAKKRYKKMQKAQEEALKATSVSANKGSLTMFKTALRNHIDLTQIADQKANIMLSVNALIITIGLPAFSTYFAGKPYLLIPGILFIATSIVSMVFATLATRPIKMSGETDLSKLKTGRTNLFFFGNFYRIPRSKYEDAIKTIVSDTEYLDSAFINDLYFLGLALGTKFRYLRTCYSIFVTGIILSAMAFIIGYLTQSPDLVK